MRVPMLIKSCRLNACLLLVSVVLTACGSGEKKDASQVAAKVNGAEITVYQINQVLSHASGITEANADKARKEILDKLVDQQLAVAKATDAKLDRTPEVVMALDAARREILARAYYEQVASGASHVDDAEIRSYYDAHPDLFSQRRIYSLTDIALKSDDKLIATLRAMAENKKSMQDIAQWLKDNDVKFEAHNYASAAERLPLDLLPSIAKLSDGQTGVIPAGQVVHVINVMQSKQEPVTFTTASPQIEKFLLAERKQKLVVAEIKRLRDAAKVEYVGAFNAPEAAPAPVAKPADAAQAKEKEDESIAKGAAGLK